MNNRIITKTSTMLYLRAAKRVATLFLLLVLFTININTESANFYFMSELRAAHFGRNGGPMPPPDPPTPPVPPPIPDPEPDPDEDEKDDNNGNTPELVCPEDGKGQEGSTPDSVNLFSGYESFKRTDIEILGLFNIKLVRKYNSQSFYDSTLGYGWSFNYDQRLFEYPDQSVVIRYGCGQKDRFIYTGSAYQTPLIGKKGKLETLPAGEYVYTHLAGTKDYYDAQGRFTARENLQGHRLEFEYDARGKLPLTGSSPYAVDPSTPMVIAKHYRLTKISERAADGVLTGNTLTLVYDENTGRLTTVTANDLRQITYVHDVTAGGKTLGNLVTVSGLESKISTYIYNDRDISNNLQDAHNITSIQEGTAAIPYVFTYDVDDRVITQTHAGTIRTFNYVVNNQNSTVPKTVKNDQGVTLYTTEDKYWFDPVTEKVSAFEDGMGNRFEYDYDAFYNPSQTRIFHNQGTVGVPSLVLQKTIDYTYDAEGNKLTETIALDDIGNGVETVTKSWSYNSGWLESEQVVSTESPKIFRTEYTFYLDGNNIPTNIKEIKRLKDDGVTFQTTTLFYDNKNRLSIKQLPDGHREHHLYEGVDHSFVTKIYHEVGNTGVVSPFDTMRLDYDANGNISDIWDANNNHTQLEYDNRDRLTKTINALTPPEETIYTYANDRLQQIEVGKTAADGEGQIIKLNYNVNNRLESIQRKNDVGTFITQVSYNYDSEGRKLTEKDGENNITQFEYDLAGNLSKAINPSLKETIYKYDATNRIISITDAELNETKYTYDDLGRRIQVEQLGVMPSIITKFTYDAVGNLTSVTDGKGQTIQYAHDTLSRKTSETKPLSQAIQYYYDGRDRLDYVLNARGQKINYLYEQWGPVNTINYYANDTTSTIDRSISMQYGFAGTVDNITDSSISASALYNYTYDDLNRRDVTTVNAYPGSSITINEDYDRFGNLNKLTLVDGSGFFVHNYSYNKLDQLASVTLPGSQVFNSIGYHNNNTLKQLTTPSGIITDYLYEANGPVKDIKFTDNTNNNVIEQYSYTFDNVRNVDSLTESAGLHDYNYDGLYRLTQAAHPVGIGLPTLENYIYDTAGNREDPGDNLLYDYDANNRITKSPSITGYSYDDDGNTISKANGEILTYDHDNNLINYTDGTVNASYKYDPAGRRINKTVDGVTTWYLWDSTNLLAEYDNSGGQLKRYAYLPNQIIPVQVAVGTSIYDIHSDHLQAPKRLTDSNRSTVWQVHYESFGNVNLAANTVEFNLRFPGQYYDQESGLHYNYFRDYDPSIGRYVESDPIGLFGGYNSYVYTNDNPVNNIDRYGLFESLIWQEVAEELGLLEEAAEQGGKCLVPCAVEAATGMALEKTGDICLDVTKDVLKDAKHVDEAWRNNKSANLKQRGIDFINDASKGFKRILPAISAGSAMMCWVECANGR